MANICAFILIIFCCKYTHNSIVKKKKKKKLFVIGPVMWYSVMTMQQRDRDSFWRLAPFIILNKKTVTI